MEDFEKLWRRNNMKEVKCVVTLDAEELNNLFDEQPEPERVAELFHELIQTRTQKKCPKCGKYLYNSDIKSYEYVCYNCEENFYGIEVK